MGITFFYGKESNQRSREDNKYSSGGPFLIRKWKELFQRLISHQCIYREFLTIINVN